MRLLAIDTTSEHGSLALLDGPHPVEQGVLHSPGGFGHVLFGEWGGPRARGGGNCAGGEASGGRDGKNRRRRGGRGLGLGPRGDGCELRGALGGGVFRGGVTPTRPAV